MKKILKVAGIILYIACLAAITCAILLYSAHTFSFGGRLVKYFAKEPMYYYYEPLVDDYISLLRDDRPESALSCLDPNLMRHYAGIYRLNTDIIKTMDDAYAEGLYDRCPEWYIHHTIEWNAGIYAEELEDISSSADRGIDLYVYLQPENSDESIPLIFEVIQRNGFWYLLSVSKDTA